MLDEEKFWNASVEELSDGYVFDESTEEYICLICGQKYEDGVLYPQIDREIFLEARKAINQHMKNNHPSMFNYLLGMDKKYTGLSEHQRELLHLFGQGLSDKEIVEINGGSASTIRNHRFKLKEKEKQAKVFLAIMTLLKTEKDTNHDFVPFHKGAKMVDDRYAVTKDEKEKILNTYFKQGPNGPLDSFPSKEKRKLVILQHIIKRFEVGKKYKESEVNEVLKTIFYDFATIRRYFIEYGFMERSKDCSEYWINQ